MKVVATEKLPIKMWLDTIEDEALAQAKNLANLPFAFHHIAIMPDAHVGYGMPIGGVLATQEVIVPNAVGVDIGCGMLAVRLGLHWIGDGILEQIVGRIRKEIPVGFSHHKEKQVWAGFDHAPDSKVIQTELESAHFQLGTLGGGNHFIEFQKGSDGFIWVMIHSGSRNFGLKVATEYHAAARRLCERWHSDIPHHDLAFLPMDDPLGKEYFAAMNFCLEFAQENRNMMMLAILPIVGGFFPDVQYLQNETTDVHHNYAAMESHFGHNVMVHRKGAIRARADDTGIIPGSMGTASYITNGLGNEESFMSSSHGAGRRMGRKEATRLLSIEEEQTKMAGIIHGLHTQSDLDEAPGAYKDIEDVMRNQSDLTKTDIRLKSLASIKG
jgi:tRNA-splicing ligase RtcB